MIKIKPDELTVIAKYIHEKSGIFLDQTKDYLIESRLNPILEELNLNNYSELYYKLKSNHNEKLSDRIIDAISTNETSFFRDKTPFDLLMHKIIPEHIERISKNNTPPYPINIWSAACSTGQEVYSIAIILKELLYDLPKYKIKILGTDIADTAVSYASYGRYSKIEIERGLSIEKLNKYFEAENKKWKIKDEIRATAVFQKINLLSPFSWVGKFDIIFCRNVAIYFSSENKKNLFEKIAYQLNPCGVLIIGSTESLYGVTDRFIRREFHNAQYYELK